MLFQRNKCCFKIGSLTVCAWRDSLCCHWKGFGAHPHLLGPIIATCWNKGRIKTQNCLQSCIRNLGMHGHGTYLYQDKHRTVWKCYQFSTTFLSWMGKVIILTPIWESERNKHWWTDGSLGSAVGQKDKCWLVFRKSSWSPPQIMISMFMSKYSWQKEKQFESMLEFRKLGSWKDSPTKSILFHVNSNLQAVIIGKWCVLFIGGGSVVPECHAAFWNKNKGRVKQFFLVCLIDFVSSR